MDGWMDWFLTYSFLFIIRWMECYISTFRSFSLTLFLFFYTTFCLYTVRVHHQLRLLIVLLTSSWWNMKSWSHYCYLEALAINHLLEYRWMTTRSYKKVWWIRWSFSCFVEEFFNASLISSIWFNSISRAELNS